jgi:hypothetical protein
MIRGGPEDGEKAYVRRVQQGGWQKVKSLKRRGLEKK